MRMMTPHWNSRDMASDLFDEVDRWFNSTQKAVYDERSFNPRCDVTETEEHYLMGIDLPGLSKEDIKIGITNNLLTISGERKQSAQTEGRFQRFERSHGFFKRSFSLPDSVNAEAIEAKYENGVLEVYIPKTPKPKPRQIEIKTTSEGFFSKSLNTSSETTPQES